LRPSGAGPAVWSLFFATYLALAVAISWPLAFRLSEVVAHDPGDPLLNTWILWWNARAVPFTRGWWDAPAFWPVGGAMAFSETLAGLAVLTTPLQWLGLGPLATYNLTLLLSWPLSALAAHALCHLLTGRHAPGVVAGLVFGFNPYRVDHVPHLQILACWWMPLAFLGLHRALERGLESGPRAAAPWLALFAAAWLLQSLSNGYLLVYFSLAVAGWLLWFVPWRSRPRLALAFAGAAAAAALPLLPVLLKYRAVHAWWGFQSAAGEIANYSGDLRAFVSASSYVRLWPFTDPPGPEQALYPGVAAVALAAAGVASAYRVARDSPEHRRRARLSILLLAAAALFAGAAVVTAVVDAWSIELGELAIRSRRAGKPLAIGLGLVVGAAVLHPRFRGAAARRSAFAFYLLLALLCWAAAAGPIAHIGDEPVFDWLPYRALLLLPGVDALRVPSRFAIVAALGLAVAAGLALARLTAGRARAVSAALSALAIGGVFADSLSRPFPLPPEPPYYRLPADAPADAVVLEFPFLDPPVGDAEAMYRATRHGRPIVNGYSGRFPDSHLLLQEALARLDADVLDALGRLRPVYLVVHRRRDWRMRGERLAAAAGATLLSAQPPFAVYALPHRPRPRARGEPIVPASVTALPASHAVPEATDGAIDTAWSAPADGHHALLAALDRERMCSGAELRLGRTWRDHPGNLLVEISPDGATWQTAWSGATSGETFLALVADPRTTPLVLPFEKPALCRFVRLRAESGEPGRNWRVAELRLRIEP
jgi:hypothetical protein